MQHKNLPTERSYKWIHICHLYYVSKHSKLPLLPVLKRLPCMKNYFENLKKVSCFWLLLWLQLKVYRQGYCTGSQRATLHYRIKAKCVWVTPMLIYTRGSSVLSSPEVNQPHAAQLTSTVLRSLTLSSPHSPPDTGPPATLPPEAAPGCAIPQRALKWSLEKRN